MTATFEAVAEQPFGTASDAERAAAQESPASDRWHDFRREADLRAVRSRRRAVAA